MTTMTQPRPPEAAPAPAPPAPRAGAAPLPPGRFRRFVRGRPEDPGWSRPALLGILGLAAFLYTWALSRNGMSNDYYATAVLAGTKSWKAMFFGSLDAANFITVDKPPLALWAPVLSARLFGFSSWSILLPQALMGVAAVGVLHATVRRAAGHTAALLAALVLALTPVTVAVTRSNIPDTLLVLLLVLAAWATMRAVESGRTGWLLGALACVGLGFNTKMLQAWIVVPAIGVTYLVAGRPRARTRVLQLAAAGGVLLVVSGLWAGAVELVPASSRPYIGGSTDNSALELALGYNGLGRIFGQGVSPGGRPPGGPDGPAAAGGPSGQAPGPGGRGAPGPGGGGAPGGRGGAPGFDQGAGPLRLFDAQNGGQIAWLLPLAAICLVAGLVLWRRRPRGDVHRALYLLFGGWLLLHFAVFSFAQGIYHPYYAIALGPGIAALVGMGAVDLWRSRSAGAAWTTAGGVMVTAGVAVLLLGRTPDWQPWLRPVVVLAGGVAVVALLVRHYVAGAGRPLAATAVAAGLLAILAGSGAYALTPLSTSFGMGPAAGPATAGGPGGPGGGPGFGPAAMPGGPATAPDAFGPTGGLPGAGPGGGPGFGSPAMAGPPPNSSPGNGVPGDARAQRGRGAFPGIDEDLIRYLKENRHGETWLVAATSSRPAGAIMLATGGIPVMAMGGFNGSDPTPTERQLARHVQEGRLRFVLLGDVPGPGRSANSAREEWVRDRCDLVDPGDYGGSGPRSELYDCAADATGA